MNLVRCGKMPYRFLLGDVITEATGDIGYTNTNIKKRSYV